MGYVCLFAFPLHLIVLIKPVDQNGHIRTQNFKNVYGGICHYYQSALKIPSTVCRLSLSPWPVTRAHADCPAN